MAESPYPYILIGVMGIIILGHWFPSLKSIGSNQSMGCTSCEKANGNISRLEQIQGIDFGALAVCRQKGLM